MYVYEYQFNFCANIYRGYIFNVNYSYILHIHIIELKTINNKFNAIIYNFWMYNRIIINGYIVNTHKPYMIINYIHKIYI